jgi:hypothetical protein
MRFRIIIFNICLILFSSTAISEGYHVDLGIKAGLNDFLIPHEKNNITMQTGYMIGLFVVNHPSKIISLQLDALLLDKVGIYKEKGAINYSSDYYADANYTKHIIYSQINFRLNRNFSDIGKANYRIFGGFGLERSLKSGYTIATEYTESDFIENEYLVNFCFGVGYYNTYLNCWLDFNCLLYIQPANPACDSSTSPEYPELVMHNLSFGISIERAFTVYKY